MGKYRVIIEIEDRTNAEASVKRYFQRADDHGRWKALDLSSCDSVPAYIIYDRVSKGVGCFKTRDVLAEVTVMLVRAIIAAVGRGLGDDAAVVADRLEHEFATDIRDVAEKYIQYAEAENSPLIVALIQHFFATLNYQALAEMIIDEAKEMRTEYGNRIAAELEAAREQTDQPSEADTGHAPEDYTITYQGYDAEAAKASLGQIPSGKKKKSLK